MKVMTPIIAAVIFIILITSIHHFEAYGGDPIPGVDISMEQNPPGTIINTFSGIGTDYGIVIGVDKNGDLLVLNIIHEGWSFPPNKMKGDLTRLLDPFIKNLNDSSTQKNDTLQHFNIISTTNTKQTYFLSINSKEWNQTDEVTGELHQPPVGQAVNGTSNSTVRLSIPSWIKHNAEWWASGQISEDEYVAGLQWMIDNGVIKQHGILKHVESERRAGGY